MVATVMESGAPLYCLLHHAQTSWASALMGVIDRR
eukprot:COSAG02_NODE_3130_length_7311_cov_25.753050_7_plen_35_part_00